MTVYRIEWFRMLLDLIWAWHICFFADIIKLYRSKEKLSINQLAGTKNLMMTTTKPMKSSNKKMAKQQRPGLNYVNRILLFR